MPGSPYIEEPPKKLLTWRRLLSFSIPSLLVTTYLAFFYDVVFQMMVAFTFFFILTAIMRR
ncbi:hypothetical protein N9M86_03975 [Euryarchaeota archaeon]|nr:hypothetical protein [Candidatus Poseidoniaceae archaeon]MDA8680151.1 hypothetical protein [Euryarchaeota archaeon]MDA8690224.1 hypothetical protein [Euryarchaeota archaeon]MDA8700460.1 hypothetical protein [Euryarchaeota archaeon]MDA8727904.1 hypothetical protein [Euryarchaeota archaeon]